MAAFIVLEKRHEFDFEGAHYHFTLYSFRGSLVRVEGTGSGWQARCRLPSVGVCFG